MANIRSGLRSFNGGELSPEFGAQVTDARYQTGLARCLNFTVLPHGPAENRAGTNYVRHAKEAVTLSRVIPFTYSNTQSMALEFGHNYIRFHTGGADKRVPERKKLRELVQTALRQLGRRAGAASDRARFAGPRRDRAGRPRRA